MYRADATVNVGPPEVGFDVDFSSSFLNVLAISTAVEGDTTTGPVTIRIWSANPNTDFNNDRVNYFRITATVANVSVEWSETADPISGSAVESQLRYESTTGLFYIRDGDDYGFGQAIVVWANQNYRQTFSYTSGGTRFEFVVDIRYEAPSP